MADIYSALEGLDQEDEDADPFKALEALDQDEDVSRATAPKIEAPKPTSEEWWKRPTSAEGLALRNATRAALPFGIGSLPDEFQSAIIRPAVMAVTGLPRLATEAGVSVGNLVRRRAGIAGDDLSSPFTAVDQALDETTQQPEGWINKGAEIINSALMGGALPAGMLSRAPSAPIGFIRPAATQAEQALREAQRAGYVVPPTSAKPTIATKLTEGLAGKAATAQAASARNQEVTNELARKALGLGKDTPITPQALKDLRTTAGKVYEQIGDTGDIVPDAQFMDDLAQLGRGADEIASAFPGANVGATKQIGEVVDSLLQDKFSSKAALQYLRELRKQASGNLSGLNAADPAKQALGMAQREAAGTLEDLIGRHLEAQGMADVAQSFNQARRVIAMSHSVENALNETTGNVIAGKLGQQMARGKPLSGELETAAQFARAFPKASKEITESMPGISPLDWAMSIGSAIGVGHVAPLAGVMVRPATRAALLSNWWQQGLTDAVPYAPQATIGMAPSAAIQAGQQ